MEKAGWVKISNPAYDLENTNSTLKNNGITEEILNNETSCFISIGNYEFYSVLSNLADAKREEILKKLNDISFNLELYEKYKDKPVTIFSFFRDVESTTVIDRFVRLSNNKKKYQYEIEIWSSEDNKVRTRLLTDSEKILPSNIHTLIGSNGIGKSYLLENVGEAVMELLHNNNTNNTVDVFSSVNKSFNIMVHQEDDLDNWIEKNDIENLIYVSYSPFEEISNLMNGTNINIHVVGNQNPEKKFEDQLIDLLDKKSNKRNEKRVTSNLDSIRLWNDLVEDMIFDGNMIELKNKLKLNEFDENTKISKEVIKELSSGQKIIFLTFAYIISYAVERTFIIIDEPELFLHPPLVTAYMRGLSKILLLKNSLCLLSTHSPFVLQEIPNNCVHIYRRDNANNKEIIQPKMETFGENILTLNTSIFGTEMRKTGFYNYLLNTVKNEEDALELLLDEEGIGNEGRAFLRALEITKEVTSGN